MFVLVFDLILCYNGVCRSFYELKRILLISMVVMKSA
jgi:hypothetical protein